MAIYPQGVEEYIFSTKWGAEDNGEGQFQSPEGIGVDGLANVYVADELNFRVQKFTADGTIK